MTELSKIQSKLFSRLPEIIINIHFNHAEEKLLIVAIMPIILGKGSLKQGAIYISY
jgi:hypothetical protein